MKDDLIKELTDAMSEDGSLDGDRCLELIRQRFSELEAEAELNDRAFKLMSEKLLDLNREARDYSDARFKLVIDHVTDAILAVDENGTIDTFNHAAEIMFGFGAAEICGRNLSILLKDVDQADCQKFLQDVASGHGSFDDTTSIEVAAVRKDGRAVEVTVSGSSAPTADPKSRKIYYILTVSNLTERKQAQIALRESAARFKTLIDHAPEAILVFDVDENRFVEVNDKAAELFRLSRDELLTRSPASVSPEFQPNGQPSAGAGRGAINQALQGGSPVFEWVYRDADGHDFPGETRLVRLPSSNSRLLRASIADISDRKRSENLAAAEKKVLEMLASDAPLDLTLDAITKLVEGVSFTNFCAIHLLDDEGCVLSCGAAPSLPKTYSSAMEHIDVNAVDFPTANAVTENRAIVTADMEVLTGADEYTSVLTAFGFRSCWAVPILGTKKQVLGVLMVYWHEKRNPNADDLELGTRVTHLAGIALEQARARKSLLDSESRYSELFANVLDGVYRTEPDGEILSANPALVKMLGYETEEQLKAAGPAQNFYEDPSDRARIGRSLEREGQIRNAEYVLLSRSGDRVVVLENARVVAGEGNEIFYEGTLTDITEMKRAEEERGMAMREFERIAQTSPHCFWTSALDENDRQTFNFVSPAWETISGYSAGELYDDQDLWAAMIVPEDRWMMARSLERIRELRQPQTNRFRIRNATDEVRWVEATMSPILDDDSVVVGLNGVVQDITESKRNQDLLGTQRTILEFIAKGSHIDQVTELICSDIETLVPDSITSIYVVDEGALAFLAGPSVAEALRQDLDGLVPALGLGSSSSAVLKAKPIIVNDVVGSDHWVDQQELAKKFGIRASWCFPIKSADGDVLGAFEISHAEPKTPTKEQLRILESAANISGLAIERHRWSQTQARLMSVLEKEKERAQITLESIGDAVITADADGTVDYLNPVAEQLTGWELREAVGQSVADVFHVVHEDTRKPIENPILRTVREGRAVTLTDSSVLIDRGGKEIAIQESAAPIRDRDGKLTGAVMVFHDVSKARRLHQQLAHQAKHDALTGLINRREFLNKLDDALTVAKRSHGSVHNLLYLDLDQFKVVNDTCGHPAGDQLLKRVTKLLKQKIRANDVIARLGGDEFCVLMENCPPERAYEVADDLRVAVSSLRFIWSERAFDISVSIGMVTITSDSDCAATVLSAADVACYAAKDAGRNRVHVYREGEAPQRHEEMQWVSRITKACEDNRLVIFEQPIIPLREDQSNRDHYELLLRMKDNNGGIIPPTAFIPAAERYNLMPTIDRWVVRYALRNLAQTNADSMERPYTLSINLSGNSLSDESFLDFVREELAEAELAPGAVCFEVTETAAIANLNHVIHFMNELKKLGCLFSLDDFGSGLSSFAYLKSLPVDYLKIDRQFIKNMTSNEIDCSFVDAFNQIGQVMGVKTVAEGVENALIQEKVTQLGVDYAQGYHFARPTLVQGRESFSKELPKLRLVRA